VEVSDISDAQVGLVLVTYPLARSRHSHRDREKIGWTY